MRTRGIQKGEGGRKSRAYFSPGGAGVESTAPNFQRPLRKRVADMKHGFESRWGHLKIRTSAPGALRVQPLSVGLDPFSPNPPRGRVSWFGKSRSYDSMLNWWRRVIVSVIR